MISIARIEMLLFLWALPFIWLAYDHGRRKRQRVLNAFAPQSAITRLVPPAAEKRRRLKGLLVLGAASLLVAAMAGPRHGYHWEPSAYRGADMVIALDFSRSMRARDAAPSRLVHAKRKIVDLTAMLQGDRVGLVVFSGSAFLHCPLTFDYAAVQALLDSPDPDRMPVGGTDLEAAVHTALAAFDPDSTATKVILLITDGEHTGRGDPAAAARAARTAGVQLFAIGVGTTAGVPIPSGHGDFVKDPAGRIVLSRLDDALLGHLAAITGGIYVRATADDTDLRAVYQERIRASLADGTTDIGRRRVPTDRYQWPLLLAVACLWAVRAMPAAPKPLVAVLLGLCVSLAGTPAQANPLQEGYAAYQQGRYDDALALFVQGLARDPDHPGVLYNIGNAHYRKGDYLAARDHYRRALARAAPELAALTWYNLGNTAYRLGRPAEAIRHYRQALALAPEDTEAGDNLAFVERQLQRPPPSGPETGRGATPLQPSGKVPADPAELTASMALDTPWHADRQETTPTAAPVTGPNGADGFPPEDPSVAEPAASGSERQASPAPAIHMLNRLTDAPGHALIPGPPATAVEKDW